jgi:hypothetical protein
MQSLRPKIVETVKRKLPVRMEAVILLAICRANKDLQNTIVSSEYD